MAPVRDPGDARLGWDPAPRWGRVAPQVAAEFPGLGIAWVEVEARPGKSPDPVRQRLRDLSDRFFGAHAIRMREQPIPWAYRVFFHQIGIDPDQTRTPVEQLALDRLHDGAFVSRGLPVDALTIATIETGVALRSFDADRIEGGLSIREAAPGESLPGRRGNLAQGTLTIADATTPVALLFGAIAEPLEVSPQTTRIALAAIEVNGVPQIATEEALWMAATELSHR
jgi:DNA/RNA-binding domain of Phe-tRNA-synthetase-like protein